MSQSNYAVIDQTGGICPLNRGMYDIKKKIKWSISVMGKIALPNCLVTSVVGADYNGSKCACD